MAKAVKGGVLRAVKKVRGVKVAHHKNTAELEVVRIPTPSKVVIPMQQHIGAPCEPVVKVGDEVAVGQLIGDSDKFVSAPIHASVSGTVTAIGDIKMPNGSVSKAVTIESDGEMRLWEGIKPPKVETREDLIKAVRDSGLVGLGGAGFPTFIKLCPPPTAKAECVILNGVECEPYITSDYRLMMEHADEILVGLDLLMKAVKVNKGYIGIEENKPAAIRLFEEKTKDNPNVEIVPLAKKYPQGGEKQLVDAVIRRQVPAPPAIPVNVGAVVQNVGTAYAVYQAVMKNKPLFERYTTVTGKKLAHPANFLVRMGTPMIDLINECGGMPEGDNKLLAGGPMMGKALTSVEVPICKGTNSVTILSGDEAKRKPAQPCIRCAKCVSACPMGLEPYLLATASALHDWEKVEAAGVTSCIECGSCQFTCPAHRPMLDNIRLGKSTVMGLIKARNAKK